MFDLFDGFFQTVWCVVTNVHRYVLYAIQTAVNGLVNALESVAQAAIDALPAAPTAPDVASWTLPGGGSVGTVLGWINWVVNVEEGLDVFWTVSGLMLVLWLANVGLRWAKVVE